MIEFCDKPAGNQHKIRDGMCIQPQELDTNPNNRKSRQIMSFICLQIHAYILVQVPVHTAKIQIGLRREHSGSVV